MIFLIMHGEDFKAVYGSASHDRVSEQVLSLDNGEVYGRVVRQLWECPFCKQRWETNRWDGGFDGMTVSCNGVMCNRVMKVTTYVDAPGSEGAV